MDLHQWKIFLWFEHGLPQTSTQKLWNRSDSDIKCLNNSHNIQFSDCLVPQSWLSRRIQEAYKYSFPSTPSVYHANVYLCIICCTINQVKWVKKMSGWKSCLCSCFDIWIFPISWSDHHFHGDVVTMSPDRFCLISVSQTEMGLKVQILVTFDENSGFQA